MLYVWTSSHFNAVHIILIEVKYYLSAKNYKTSFTGVLHRNSDIIYANFSFPTKN